MTQTNGWRDPALKTLSIKTQRLEAARRRAQTIDGTHTGPDLIQIQRDLRAQMYARHEEKRS